MFKLNLQKCRDNLIGVFGQKGELGLNLVRLLFEQTFAVCI
jgi:hypothetical protein